MKQFILFVYLLLLFSTIMLGQDLYPRLLEKVDATKIWHSTPGVIPENIMMSDPIVGDIINQTNLDSLISYVRILSGEDSVWIGNSKVLIQNRGSSGGNLAADYLIQKLESYNLEVEDQTYSSTGRNVYAVQEGYLYPEKQYIICAHYDAADVYCADDNASGVAAVIEAARILSGYDFKYTLVYALWDEEEIGLVGSNYYASQAASNQEQIQGVLNMDMLARDGNDDGLLDIHTQNTANSNNIANMIVIVNWMYGLPLNPVIYNPGTWQSDHSSFWNYGYGAALLIEAYYGGDLNPYYHGIEDRIDKFNLPYFHNLSKLSMGTISTLLEVTTDTLLASVTPNIGYQTYSANVQIKGVNTHFLEGAGTKQVWLSKDQETIISDSFVVSSNTILNAYIHIPASASTGKWDLNVQSNVDGIITKENCFNILSPPAIIVVNPDSLVVSVLSGSTRTKILTISNQGESNLYFNIKSYLYLNMMGGNSSTNYALQFDGVDDVVTGPASQFPVGNSSRTLELWFKRISQPFEEGHLFGYGGWGWENADRNFGISLHQSDWFFSQWGIAVLGSTIIQSNQWYHSAVVNVGNNVVLYLNGEVDGTGNLNINTLSNTSFYMGKAPPEYDENRKLNGFIDEVRIWNVALTHEDIQGRMHQQLAGTEPGLVGYWQFNEGTGITAHDKTGNAQNGSLQGGVTWINSSAPIGPSWLTSSLDSGICFANSAMGIEFLFDATELDTGDYYGSIVIKSSDPFSPSVVVPIHLIVSTAVGIEDEFALPTVYNLYQNFPNSFNPSTTIKYSIPKESQVSLIVFNLLGEEITTLVNAEQSAGNYSIEFNAATLPSGVYFYQLKAGEYLQTKKMILLK